MYCPKLYLLTSVKVNIARKFFLQLVLLIANVQPFLIKSFYYACDLPYTIQAKQIILNYQIMVSFYRSLNGEPEFLFFYIIF